MERDEPLHHLAQAAEPALNVPLPHAAHEPLMELYLPLTQAAQSASESYPAVQLQLYPVAVAAQVPPPLLHGLGEQKFDVQLAP